MIKKQNLLLAAVIMMTTLALCYVLPQLFEMMTSKKDDYPFVYYSSKLREIVLIDYSDKSFPMSDLEGNKYSTAQFDTLVPLLNYRQLMANENLPDSIDGHEITPRILAMNSVVFRFNPKSINAPKIDLYGMLESMPLRVGLSAPEDFFRIKNSIDFIDAQSNKVNEAKSDRFQNELIKRGYQFPTKWAAGDANTRKSYDEGYFCLDSNDQLFHVKMVNGRPFVKNTGVGDSIKVAHFAPMNVPTKRLYGFIFSEEGELYILESDEKGGYQPLRLDIGAIDIKNDQLVIMGNLLYWNVAVTTKQGREYHALRSDDLTSVATHKIEKSPKTFVTKLFDRLQPLRLTMTAPDSDYIYPRFSLSFFDLVMWSILAIQIPFYLGRRYSLKMKIFTYLIAAIGGLAGLIALGITLKFNKKIELK